MVLPRFAVTMLQGRHDNRPDSPHDAVFPSRRGTWMSPHNMRRQWRRARADTELNKEVETLFKKIVAKVSVDDGGKGINLKAALRSVEDDPIAMRLRSIFEERVGLPYPGEVFSATVQAGQERFAHKIPPGYMDREKVGQEEEGTGDYLLWGAND